MNNIEIQKIIEERSIPVTESGCWIWLWADNGKGYGRVTIPKHDKQLSAHRVSYEAFIGKIPNGLHLDHLCRVRCCVNPLHLEPVTNRENVLRGIVGKWQLAKTHCPKGHPYSGENLYNYPVTEKSGRRRGCRICIKAALKKSKDKKNRNGTQPPEAP